MVDAVVPSAATCAGFATTVELAGVTVGAAKTTDAVAVTVMLSVVSLAV